MVSKAFGTALPAQGHLVKPGGGLSGEIYDLRKDIDAAFVAVEGDLATYVFRPGAIPCEVTDVDGIATTFNTVILGQILSDDDLTGALVVDRSPKIAIISPPKLVTLTVAGTGTPTDWDDGDVIFTGTNVDGAVQTETVTSTGGGAQTITSTLYYATIDTVELPVATGTGADLTLGVVADLAPIASITSSLSAQDLNTNGEFNRTRVGNRDMGMARSLSIVISSHANWDATTMIVTGLDAQGNTITENFSIPDTGNTTLVSDKFFQVVTRIQVPVQSGTSGTMTVGFVSTNVGLPQKILNGAIAASGLRELIRTDENDATWAVPSAGTVTAFATDPPYGSWTPNDAPNGVMEYIFIFFTEPSA